MPGLREFVPRTDREAIVAAIDAVADQRPQLARDRAFVLDGEIGDAAPRIEPIGRGKCRGRTDIEAGAASAAMIVLAPHRGGRSSVVKIAPRNSQEPKCARDQIGVLALPAEARRRASGFSITAAVSTKTLISPPALSISQRPSALQPRLDHIVIVVAARIDRDARRACARCRIASGSSCAAVIDAEHDNRSAHRPTGARIAAPVGIARHPVHVAMRAGVKKRAQPRRRLRDRVGPRNADASKPSARAASVSAPSARPGSEIEIGVGRRRHQAGQRLDQQRAERRVAI